MFSAENLYFSDCVLRHMHEYRFIAHHDLDEVPMIKKGGGSYPTFLDYLLDT